MYPKFEILNSTIGKSLIIINLEHLTLFPAGVDLGQAWHIRMLHPRIAIDILAQFRQPLLQTVINLIPLPGQLNTVDPRVGLVQHGRILFHSQIILLGVFFILVA
jgi:hypothetical protein